MRRVDSVIQSNQLNNEILEINPTSIRFNEQDISEPFG
jgi:hypothetical protein